MRRCFDADYINRIANDPSIYPWVRGPVDGPIDVSPIINNENNIAMMGEHGGVVFLFVSVGVYDGHSLVLPSGRGRWVLKAARESLNWIFTHYAKEVLMTVPEGNVAVRALVKCLKAKFKYREEAIWWRDGKKVPADIYSLTKEDWEKCQSA